MSCHVNDSFCQPLPSQRGRRLLSTAVAKREREAKYGSFGSQLRTWRGARAIGTVVRQAKAMGANLDEPTLRGWEYGWTASPDPISLMALAAAYGVQVDEMLWSLADARRAAGQPIAIPRAAPRPESVTAPAAAGAGQVPDVEFLSVPILAGRIAAGEPLLIEDGSYSGALAFSARFLKKWKSPICVRVGQREMSMVPLITPNDIVLLDCSEGERQVPQPDNIYAVRVDGGATLKRAQFVKQDGRGWLALISENPDKRLYPARFVAIEEDKSVLDYIVGRVVWRGQYV